MHVPRFIANRLVILIAIDMILLSPIKLILNVARGGGRARKLVISVHLILVAECVAGALLAGSGQVGFQLVSATLTLRDLAHGLRSIVMHHHLLILTSGVI